MVGIYCLSCLVFSGLIALNKKRVWQGEFQILLDSDYQSKSLPISSPKIAKFAGLDFQKNTLKTEVGILKSPSVLMNVFEYVKTNKALRRNSSNYDLRFQQWRDASLDISLETNQALNIDIINYKKQKDSLSKIILKMTKKDSVINFKEIEFKENKNKIKFEDLKINKKDFVSLKKLKVKTFINNNSNNDFEISFGKHYFSLPFKPGEIAPNWRT